MSGTQNGGAGGNVVITAGLGGTGASANGAPGVIQLIANGVTWTWSKVAEGGGKCEGIDPGLAVRGDETHILWWDAATGKPQLNHA